MHYYLFLVFFRKDNKFIVKSFWPHRSIAKGFSIENLARKYREKMSGASSDKVSNQSLDETNLKSLELDSKNILISNLSSKKVHWANRDFSEYRDVA